MPFRVTVQGISPDLTYADGDYDSGAEYSVQTPDELTHLLRRIQSLQTPSASPDADVCPANLVVTVGRETFTFMPNGGQLWSPNAAAYVSPEQGVQMITTPGIAGAARAAVQQGQGLHPLRRPDVAPTDRENFWVDYIDTGPQQPQVMFEMTQKPGTMTDIITFGGFGLALFVVGVAMLVSGAVPGVFVLGAGAGLMFWAYRINANARAVVRMGFDWKWNVLWATRPDKATPDYVLDANTLSDVVAEQRVEEHDAVFPVGDALPTGPERHKYWTLWFLSPDGERHLLSATIHFYKKSDRDGAIQAIRSLLASQ